jgi:hypothetical protein
VPGNHQFTHSLPEKGGPIGGGCVMETDIGKFVVEKLTDGGSP